MDCSELISDVIAIYPVPADGPYINQVPARIIRTNVPVSSLSRTDGKDFFSTLRSEPGMIAESYNTDSAPAGTLEIMDFPTLKSSPKNNVAGNYFEVTISAKSIMMIDQVQDFSDRIDQYETIDVYILDSEGNWYIVRGLYRAFSLSVNYKLPNRDAHEISLTLSNVNGVQRIVIPSPMS